MIPYELFLAQTVQGEWHILDTKHNVIGRFSTQETAMEEIDRLMGTKNWSHGVVMDTTDGAALAVLDKRKATVN